MDIQNRPSPNLNDRAKGSHIDMIVLHYTGMQSAEAALKRLCDPESEVSTHYVVDEAGSIFRLVVEEKRAWHAGISSWQGASNINDRSIGIEIVNPGHEFGYQQFPQSQMMSVHNLLREVILRYQIPPSRVVGHSDIAPARKQDPGEFFDWQGLAAEGLAVLPYKAADPVTPADVSEILTEIGYDPDVPLSYAITAFQRRFVPHAISGKADLRTRSMIAAVAAIKS